ncbi:hypothetical protein [Viscerimonas tarda]
MKSVILYLVFLSVMLIGCSDNNRISDDYYFVNSDNDTLLLFPTEEIILLRNGKSYYLRQDIIDINYSYRDIRNQYKDYHNKNNFLTVFSAYGSPYRLFDGYISMIPDIKTDKISILELAIFHPDFLVDEKLDLYYSIFFCFEYTEEYKRKAKEMLFKERNLSKEILKTDGIY